MAGKQYFEKPVLFLRLLIAMWCVFACLMVPFKNTSAQNRTQTIPSNPGLSSNTKLEIFPQVGHSVKVLSVAFSPDGNLIASGSADATIKLWNRNGRLLRTFNGHTGMVASIAFSPDGRTILSGGSDFRSLDNTLKLWDVATGKEIRTFTGHPTQVKSVVFSPDGLLALTGNGDKTLELWNVATGQAMRTFTGHSESVNSVAFSPDGRTVVSGSSDKTIKLWDVTTTKELISFTELFWVSSVAFSPDGRTVLSGTGSDNKDIKVKLREVTTGKIVREFTGSTKDVYTVAFSPNGKNILSGGEDRTIRLWDIGTGTEIKAFKGHSRDVNAVAFSPDGRYILSGGGEFIEGCDCSLKLWDVASGRELVVFEDSTGVMNVAYSSDGRSIFSGLRHNFSYSLDLNIWDITNGGQLHSFNKRSISPWSFFDPEISIAFSPNGRFVLCSAPLELWDLKTGQLLRQFTGHTAGVYAVAFSSDGQYVASGSSDKTIKLWNVETGKEIQTFSGHSERVESVAFSPDGRFILSGSLDQTLKTWDVTTGKEIRTFSGHSGTINYVAFSPNGRSVFSRDSDKTLKIWDLKTGQEIRSFSGNQGYFHSIALSPDGRFAISAIDTTVRMLDLISGREVRLFNSQSVVVTSVAWSPNSRTILLGGLDGSTRLVDVATGEELLQMVSYKDGEWVALTPQGYYTTSPGGEMYLNVRTGNSVQGIEKYRSQFNKPELVAMVLSGKKPTEPNTVTTPKPPDSTALGKYYALVIGINRYSNIRQLATAVKDARDIAQTLNRDFGFETKLLLDQEATRDAILTALNDYRKKLGPNDNLVIYFAGHGEYDADVEKGYWIPVDARLDENVKWVSADDVTTNLKGIPAQHILVVSDSCYSGTIARDARSTINPADRNRYLVKMREGRSRMVISSGGKEPVADGGGEGHSVFAQAFLNRLIDMDQDQFSAEELFNEYVKIPVAGKSDQVPEYNALRNSGHEKGGLVFIRRKIR